MARLTYIRPSETPTITGQNQYDQYVLNWWQPLGKLSEEIDTITDIDLKHLIGLSCVIQLVIRQDLNDLLALLVNPQKMFPTISKFEEFPWWQRFVEKYNEGRLNYLILTSTGSLIGTLYHDSILGASTHINW